MTNFCFILISAGTVLGATAIPQQTIDTAKSVDSVKPDDSKIVKTTINGTDDDDDIPDKGWEYENTTFVETRRILYSKRVPPSKRPYMVYLQLTKESAKAHKYRGWLCGGVIVDPYYVLTSAACVEDADRFYIVSGTTKFVDSFDYKSDDCVCKHRRRVVWKCIPKNYKFDFQDSIKWSSNDIAIVKVDKPFKLGVCEKGCEFATDIISYNNISRELEKAGTKGYIAGWGSGNNFREGVYRKQSVHIPENAKTLQEAKVCIMDNEQCAKRWAQRFRNIITQYMICTKDVMKKLSEICDKKYANCTEVDSRRQIESSGDSSNLIFNIDLGRHLRNPDDYTARRAMVQGGFCENDHGGPLIVKYKGKERVIGVISACKIDPKTHSCHGPFLYTSVFKNRQFISCAIHKDVEDNCRRVFRSGITHEEWSVNWDNVKEDEDDDKAEGDKADKDSDSDGENSKKEGLRVEKIKGDKEDESDDSSDSDDSKNEEDVKKHKKGKVEKVEGEEKEEKEEKKQLKKKQSNRHGQSKKKHSSASSSKKAEVKEDAKEVSGEAYQRGQKRSEVFYQSSRDENVNEPEDE